MAFIEINGKKVEVKEGQSIIDVADAMGIQIPRFCYHKQLSVAANCRMCLVEVEKAPKLLPACATPITDGMKIQTRSAKVLSAQQSVLEFFLLNHPLDCPVCDQGGECELQDLSMGYGKDFSRYEEEKRVIQDKDLGPLIQSDMTRCIHCTRCVRFGSEITGMRELGGIGRGEATEIGTFLERNIDSEVSANIIDLCPVGALTSKPFRYAARAWELRQKASIAPHDCVGSPIYVHIRDDKVLRVVPKNNPSLKASWLSDRDRFAYECLYTERLKQPKIKINQIWKEVSWCEAVDYTRQNLLSLIEKEGASSVGALASPNATVEEYYLLQAWLRDMGCNNIDHRLRQSDFRCDKEVSMDASLYPNLGMSLKDLAEPKALLLVGSDLRKEQPILGLSVRKMVLSGGDLCVINPIDFDFNIDLAHKTIVEGGDLVLGLAKLLKALLALEKTTGSASISASEVSVSECDSGAYIPVFDDFPSLESTPLLRIQKHLSDHKLLIGEEERNMARCLKSAKQSSIVVGALALTHPDYAIIHGLCVYIAQILGASFGVLTEGSNSSGAWLMGCVPHRLPGGISIPVADRGLNVREMVEASLKAYILFNMELEDTAFAHPLSKALDEAKYVIAFTPFENQTLLEKADILLPITPFTETAGTRVNIEGHWQSFEACHAPFAHSKAGWEVLSLLSEKEESLKEIQVTCETVFSTSAQGALIPGMENHRIQGCMPLSDVQKNVPISFSECWRGALIPGMENHRIQGCMSPSDIQKNLWDEALDEILEKANDSIVRIASVPLYASDGLLRRSSALQKTKDAGKPALYLNERLAKKLGLEEGAWAMVHALSGQWPLPCVIDPRIPNHTALIPAGFKETLYIGLPYETIKIYPVEESSC